MPWTSRFLLLLLLPLFGCGVALQQARVTRSFSGRFHCQAERTTWTADGYHVEGCGRRAEYVCFPDRSYPARQNTSAGGVLAAAAISAMFGGVGGHCVLAHSEQDQVIARVASSAPVSVGRVRSKGGRTLLKTRVLFSGGSLRAVAAPREHPERVLLVVHSVARMQDAPCKSELFVDGLPVPVLEQAREGHYDARLVVPVAALAGVHNAVRFAGAVCGSEFELDASGRSTLALFASQFLEERERAHSETALFTPSPSAAPVSPGSLP